MQHLGKIIIGITVIITAFILSAAWKYKFKGDETIVVTGLSEKDFVSDMVVWRGSFSQTSMDLRSAYQAIKENEKAV
ncbi:MAG TPA: SIMPL domain-containing protein, partial [Phnomibacter sp.]|nr:SIMPL domain-containing protein [Phnomibacter sp.]